MKPNRYLNSITRFGFAASLLLLISCQTGDGSKSKNSSEESLEFSSKPNVLFICVDDLRPELGCYGSEYIHSPNLDRLAESGAVFTNHFVQIPTCGASRHSMLTGMLPSERGHLSNEACKMYIAEKRVAKNSRAEDSDSSDVSGSSERVDRPETFIQQLKSGGYHTVGIGKISHYVDGLLYGYNDPIGTERELPNSWSELLFDPAKWGTGWNAFFGYADGENRQSMKKQVKPYECGDVDDLGYPDGVTAELAVAKMRELKESDRPFFLGVGFFKPHLPFNAPKKYWDIYSEEDIPLAPFAEIPEGVSRASLHNSGEFNGYQKGEEKGSLNANVSDAYARKVRHGYFACVSYVDSQIGKVLDELERLELDSSTIVVVWGDHGWHLGDQRVWGKHTIFENALKSAFIVKVPGKTDGTAIDKVVSTVDIYPTILELCGVEQPYNTDGSSLLPLLEEPASSWNEASFSYFKNGITLRTERYRFTRYFRNGKIDVELYDHKVDPNETKNIAEESPEIIKTLMPIWERGNTGIYGE